MWKHFVDGFLEGLAWLFIGIFLLLMIVICAAPIALALIYGSAWWLLCYGIIVPTGFGVYNTFENLPIFNKGE